MDGILIFNQGNDLIYRKFDNGMKIKIREIAISHGLVKENVDETEYLHSNVIIQIFAPIIASQKIMFCQFDNSYTSIQSENNDFNMVFEEFLGYLFIKIGKNSVDNLQRSVGVCISFVKHLCGPDVSLIKTMNKKADLLTIILDSWTEMYNNDQAILVEAVEQLLVNTEVRNVALKTLQLVTEKLKQDPHSKRSHAIIFVKNKFLSLYSSSQAQDLSASDILFLNIFCNAMEPQADNEKSNDENTKKHFDKKIQTYLLFLNGNINGLYSGCIPHIVHITNYNNDIKLVILIEYGSLTVSTGIYDIFFSLQKLQNLQMQFDIDNLKPAFDNLDVCVKQTLDALKKAKYNNNNIENSIKKFILKWDILKKKYLDLFKMCNKELIVKIESNIPAFFESLKEIFKLTCFNCNTLEHGHQRISEISIMVEEKLNEFTQFLQVKALRNFTMGSYLEEFSGLVHFIHIDRKHGRVVAPNLEFTTKDKPMVPKEKIWSMIDLSRSYLQKGHISMMWKDMTFNYSYFLWFEDSNGQSLKAKELPNVTNTNVKPLLQPGIMAGEFYQRLIENSFPKIPSNKIKCFELFCIHLGLVTASCVLEHCRRLAATINDVTGIPNNPIDLL